MKLFISLAVLGLVSTPAAALADDMTMPMGGGASDKAFMDSMRTMMKNMDVKPSGDADKDFVAMMLPHHQGAVDMAKVELQYGKDPMLRRLARDIVKAQDKEIAMMTAWQVKHGK